MTLNEMIKSLQAIRDSLPEDEDPKVKLACQPNWPFEYEVNHPALMQLDNDKSIVYLPEGGSQDYLQVPGSDIW